MKRRRQHELLPFLAIWADQYRRDYGLDGIHPVHWALMKKHGAPMERFKRATNGVTQHGNVSDSGREHVRETRQSPGAAHTVSGTPTASH